MEEQIKIIVDKKGFTHIWINGEEQRHITKVKLNIENDNVHYPRLVIEKEDFVTNMDTKKIKKLKKVIIM